MKVYKKQRHYFGLKQSKNKIHVFICREIDPK